MDVKLERKRILNNIYLKLEFLDNELEEIFSKVRLIYEKKNIVEELYENKVKKELKQSIKKPKINEIEIKVDSKIKLSPKITKKVIKQEYVLPQPKKKVRRTKKRQRIARSVIVLDTSSEDLSDSDY